jgi:FkbM family methyltransferase
MDAIYRPPFAIRTNVVVDLGANIGLTTRWIHHHLGPGYVVAIEASNGNSDLLERNVPTGTKVIRAAVGPSDGIAHFANDSASNLGHVTERGEPVRQIAMGTVLALLPAGGRIDLLKLDIEGGEQALLTQGDLTWLDKVDAIIAEFHPEVVDYPRLIAVLVNRGFEYRAAGSAWPGSMDAFVRPA